MYISDKGFHLNRSEPKPHSVWEMSPSSCDGARVLASPGVRLARRGSAQAYRHRLSPLAPLAEGVEDAFVQGPRAFNFTT